MTEKYIEIPGADGNRIYGKHCVHGNKKLVIHIHGLTHQPHYLLEVTSSEFFEVNGYDHYRIGLYDRLPGSRRLNESTLSTHKKDIQSVLDYFQDRYESIFITAHSLGGLATFLLNPKTVKATSLWDPSFDVTKFWATGSFLTYIPERREYHLDYGNIFVLGEDMVEEVRRYPNEKCLELARAVTTPTQFVIPEESIFRASVTSPADYQSRINGPFDLTRIAGANHVFSNRGNRQELFRTVLAWFDKF